MERFRAEAARLKAEAEKRAHQEEAARISSMALGQAKKKASGNKKSQRQSNIPQGFQKQSQRQIQLTPEEKAHMKRLRAERNEREKKRKQAAAAERARVQAIRKEQIRQNRSSGQQRRREKEAMAKQLKQLELSARKGSDNFAPSTQPQPPLSPPRKSVTPEQLRRKLEEARRRKTDPRPPNDPRISSKFRQQRNPVGRLTGQTRRAPGTEQGKTRTSRSGEYASAGKQTRLERDRDRRLVRDLQGGRLSRKKRKRKKKKTRRKNKKKSRRKNKRKKRTKRRRRKRKKTRRRRR